MKRLAFALGVAATSLSVSTEAFASDIAEPTYRSTRGSAYTHEGGQFFAEVGLLGVRSTDLYATLGVGVGIGFGLEVSVNIAHASAALFNFGAKWNFLETRFGALSIGFDPTYIAGDLMWLPPYDRLLTGFDVWILPLEAGYTLRTFDWLEVDLLANYTDIETRGTVDPNALIFDGEFGVSHFSLRPGLRAHVMGRLSFYTQLQIPLWLGTENFDTTDFGNVLVTVGARTMMSDHWFLDFGVNSGGAVKPLYGSNVFPRLSIEARF